VLTAADLKTESPVIEAPQDLEALTDSQILDKKRLVPEMHIQILLGDKPIKEKKLSIEALDAWFPKGIPNSLEELKKSKFLEFSRTNDESGVRLQVITHAFPGFEAQKRYNLSIRVIDPLA